MLRKEQGTEVYHGICTLGQLAASLCALGLRTTCKAFCQECGEERPCLDGWALKSQGLLCQQVRPAQRAGPPGWSWGSLQEQADPLQASSSSSPQALPGLPPRPHQASAVCSSFQQACFWGPQHHPQRPCHLLSSPCAASWAATLAPALSAHPFSRWVPGGMPGKHINTFQGTTSGDGHLPLLCSRLLPGTCSAS